MKISALWSPSVPSAPQCGLFPTEAGQVGGVTKAQFRSLCDANFRWPGEEAVRPEVLPTLAKNIAVNFMEYFFEGEGRAIMRCEVK